MTRRTLVLLGCCALSLGSAGLGARAVHLERKALALAVGWRELALQEHDLREVCTDALAEALALVPPAALEPEKAPRKRRRPRIEPQRGARGWAPGGSWS